MLTAKGKYGLKALVHLSSLAAGETAQAIDIAEANNIPKKFLDAILGELRNAGIVHSKKGPGGGYMLARPPGEIKLGLVVRTLDGRWRRSPARAARPTSRATIATMSTPASCA